MGGIITIIIDGTEVMQGLYPGERIHPKSCASLFGMANLHGIETLGPRGQCESPGGSQTQFLESGVSPLSEITLRV